MSKIIKHADELLVGEGGLEILASLVGKIVHAKVNYHEVTDATGNIDLANIWFAGMVAGYDVTTVYFDYEANAYLDTPIVKYRLLLTDGMAYVLAYDCELHELEDEEFVKLVEDFTKEQLKKESMILPEDKKILIQGKDF